MGIHEMHVAVDVWLQKINSNSRRNILPEEKDMVLNSVIQDFVSSNIKQDRPDGEWGFHNDEVNADSISTLLEQFRPVSVYPSTKRSGYLEVQLPSDFRNFISFSAITVPVHCMNSEELLYPRTTEITNYLYTFKIPVSEGSGPFYKNVTLNWGGQEFKKTSDGTSDPNLQSFVYSALKSIDLPVDVIDIYWEKYPSRIYQKNTIVIKTATKLTMMPTMTLDSIVLSSIEVTLTETINNKNNQYSTKFNAISRRIKPQYIETLQQSSFSKSTFQNLTLTLQDDLLLIPNDEKFLVILGALSYVRKPAEVSLSLGIDCDLPNRGEVHNYICQKAAEEISLAIDSPSWQARFELNKTKK